MPYHSVPVVVPEEVRETLLQWTRSGTSEHRMVERAKIVLLASEGLGTYRAKVFRAKFPQSRTE